MRNKKHIAILGGGPSALFMFKQFVDAKHNDFTITIFEKSNLLGAGMPYSAIGANDEHVTNVSGNEIPEMVTSINDWIKTVSKDTLDKFHIDPKKFNEYKVLPRLLFGQYLTAQFNLLQKQAKEQGLKFEVHYDSEVTNVTDNPDKQNVIVEINNETKHDFDQVIICTGHNWPKKNEGKVPGYFDSPYPPVKLIFKTNDAVAIRGSSLTAIDAIRTLSRHNGTFNKGEDGKLTYTVAGDSKGFKMVMHSRNGLLPAVRFHLEDSHLATGAELTPEEIKQNREENNGFLSLDLVFEKDFKLAFKDKQPDFYERIKDMRMEDFVNDTLEHRKSIDPFELFKIEYKEAEISIEQHKSVYWKEMLGVLSFAMNYPAKYFSAEDMMRIQKVLMPLISVVIAYAPQSSVEEMMALHQAGALDIIIVGDNNYVEPIEEGGAIYHYTDEQENEHAETYKIYVDCVGQPHLTFDEFSYKGLSEARTVTPAKLWFKSPKNGQESLKNDSKKVKFDGKGGYYLTVPGVTINDSFQAIDDFGAFNERLYIMAVPYIGGYNPDYSGLDFCQEASGHIIKSILNN
ncbi:FAD/NAD(P)-binding protein [Mucilaginibacter sp. 10I4]|uniref:FAD/NAD(P)-binding protein n=1 Tax=Mucilaginibacter sp. 10I4 TaxID=3048580 RepID=UPI002B2299E3|nr:FAD/NAD(P)-binding protein [Mucilaginibacter sp. 10I4]MEB0263228.1 FAD/NAD(P)-binding protein [Mucilaginibacter sp. 10I4]